MNTSKHDQRIKRSNRIRNKIGSGSANKPRLVIFCSNRATFAQLIDDEKGITLVSAHSLKIPKGKNIQAAELVGRDIAKKAKEKKIDHILFDRNGYRYHGRVKSLAEGARTEGLSF